MGVLLSPGIRVLSQFGFARKFALLLVLFILPLAVSLWLLGADSRPSWPPSAASVVACGCCNGWTPWKKSSPSGAT